MSSVPRVTETTVMVDEELGGDTAWATFRKHRREIAVESFRRFRFGDGFSHSRALGLQLALTLLPLMIAAVGLANSLYMDDAGMVMRRTLLFLTPGPSDPVVRTAFEHSVADDASQIALWVGLLFAVISMTTGMGQVERGANRIYGIQRDRPTVQKYTRAFSMAVIAGFPALAGYALLIAAPAFSEAIEDIYGIDDDTIEWIALPLGLCLLMAAITLMLRLGPRRRQPSWSWLVLGAVVTLALWLIFTALVALYLAFSDRLGNVYGPLTGVVVLLLWSMLSSVAIFVGLAICAQTEARLAGGHQGAFDDREAELAPTGSDDGAS
ncbi:YihY/virulence factor BrkB family protein [Mycobacterium sp. PSTR-4-N]|uniref:YihY/virulence factor BrkB family protein n=1 Tax=Mycobacterium sp. PSTR-4-N TaxID=2917745 RepID=UPI001F14D7C6|nr:YihY/virulence factor BrkB family protein [Mycobacterium sp. PSTR-4-N]MCG7595684.1 YihY/virulence factor BrkB family protein [Mycobacterium sp. PSTR-4-N]